ncbi:MAG TPA: potassium channel family protein [Gemmataceae bacterium]|nr:potassium channel family protein [Gemmataceae bacterium]
MAWLGVAAAAVLIWIVFVDAFEAVILPRRVRHGYRLASLFYGTAWFLWTTLGRLLPAGRWRSGLLSTFGPLSLFGLIGVWAAGLITGFALMHWSLGTPLSASHATDHGLGHYLYFSGTTFFTLGYGDVVPTDGFGKALSVAEAGIGFGFLALVISYLPVLHQAFSRREITISLLDARAGSPPSAGELLRRRADAGNLASIEPLLVEWERWAAELLESHLSFPVLRFYRSQHDNQSWVGALTVILDTSAYLIAKGDATDGHQARLTFAMARHAAVDLLLVSQTPLRPPESDRLPAADLARFQESLAACGVHDEPGTFKTLTELRGLYEPFVNALAIHLQLTLPPYVAANRPVDNWQTSPGMERSPGLSDLQAAGARDEHSF